eukprot:scaffold14553_cov120-Isochrysis_galbana.AAC.6
MELGAAILKQNGACWGCKLDIGSAWHHSIMIWAAPHLRSPKYSRQAEKLALRTKRRRER